MQPAGNFATGWLFRDYIGEFASAMIAAPDNVAESIAVASRKIVAAMIADPNLAFIPRKGNDA